MMILRVYAIWNRSRRILGILVFIYMMQIIMSVVVYGIYANPSAYLSGMSLDKSVLWMPPQMDYHALSAIPFSRHRYLNPRFLFLQCCMEHPTKHLHIFHNGSTIYYRCYAVYSRPYPRFEGVSCNVQRNQVFAA